jgi:hypothetical protein
MGVSTIRNNAADICSWRVSGTPAQIAACIKDAARAVSLTLEIGEDQMRAGALCGWAYIGNASGTPAGRMEVAEVRLACADDTLAGDQMTAVELRRVDGHIPSRFEKQWNLHEVRFKRPVLWSRFAAEARRRLGPSTTLNLEPGTLNLL